MYKPQRKTISREYTQGKICKALLDAMRKFASLANERGAIARFTRARIYKLMIRDL